VQVSYGTNGVMLPFFCIFLILTMKLLYSKYLDQVARNQEEKPDKHRFLVQSRIIDDAEYTRVTSLPAAQRGDEVHID
jgi:hypothetical protein